MDILLQTMCVVIGIASYWRIWYCTLESLVLILYCIECHVTVPFG